MDMFVICGQDCNKNTPKIINCFSSVKKCVDWLNEKGKKLISKDFDINKFSVDEECAMCFQSEAMFEHMELFKHLFVDGNMITDDCLHRGAIHIMVTTRKKGFAWIYDEMQSMYA